MQILSADPQMAMLLDRVPAVLTAIPDILRNPAANPMQAVLVLSILLGVALLVLVIGMLAVTRPRIAPEDRPVPIPPADHRRMRKGPDASGTQAGPLRAGPLVTPTAAALVVIAVALAWSAACLTTSTNSTCISCHQGSAHATAHTTDPHRGLACVACHESGGVVGAATFGAIARMQHFVSGATEASAAAGYGRPVPSEACSRCHGASLSGTRTNSASGVKMSHREPLAAGALCVDCHALAGGVIALKPKGMSTCMTCHDGARAASACGTCHVGDPGRAVEAPTPQPGEFSSRLVRQPDCGLCHVSQKRCDACHGLRMPHTMQFKEFAHARDAAVQLWANNGHTPVCNTCHYPGHRDCLGCHGQPFLQHGTTWADGHRGGSWSGSGSGCSCHGWDPTQHGGLNFCQICHATKPNNARP